MIEERDVLPVLAGDTSPIQGRAEFGVNYLKLDSDTPYEDWHRLFRSLQDFDKAVRWWEGDALNFGDNAYGEKYSQAVEDGDNYGKIAISAFVANRFHFLRRRKNLGFTHHQDVAKLSDEEQDFLLDSAEWWIETTEGKPLSSSTMRALVKCPKRGREKLVKAAQNHGWSSKDLREAAQEMAKKLEEDDGEIEFMMSCPKCGGTGLVSAGTPYDPEENSNV